MSLPNCDKPRADAPDEIGRLRERLAKAQAALRKGRESADDAGSIPEAFEALDAAVMAALGIIEPSSSPGQMLAVQPRVRA